MSTTIRPPYTSTYIKPTPKLYVFLKDYTWTYRNRPITHSKHSIIKGELLVSETQPPIYSFKTKMNGEPITHNFGSEKIVEEAIPSKGKFRFIKPYKSHNGCAKYVGYGIMGGLCSEPLNEISFSVGDIVELESESQYFKDKTFRFKSEDGLKYTVANFYVEKVSDTNSLSNISRKTILANPKALIGLAVVLTGGYFAYKKLKSKK